jgi:AraC family transcriptional regulator, transcriptional activator of pobA
MIHTFIGNNSISIVHLFVRESLFGAIDNQQNTDLDKRFYTIVWNKGPAQRLWIDKVPYLMEANALLPIMMCQRFRFEHPEQIVAWQFSREFYCIVNHDEEVGCVGFVFYGPSSTMFVQLDEEAVVYLQQLQVQFESEFGSDEAFKGEMLRALLVRLIIFITRLAKKQYFHEEVSLDSHFDLVRKYNLLVERHYRQQHQVAFYADLLNKSPKTLSNIFKIYSNKSPVQVIHERLGQEAKRLLFYTDQSVKEIAYHLGFVDATHFSHFFKKITGQSPSDLRKSIKD